MKVAHCKGPSRTRQIKDFNKVQSLFNLEIWKAQKYPKLVLNSGIFLSFILICIKYLSLFIFIFNIYPYLSYVSHWTYPNLAETNMLRVRLG